MSLQRSIVLPAYNEVRRLAAGYERLAPILTTWGVDTTEIVVIDDGSTDGTLKEVARVYGHLPLLKVVQQPHNMGKGAAVRLGWATAKGAHVITADADMAIRPEHFPAIDEALTGANFAPGTRLLDGAIRYDSWRRTIAGSLFHRIVAHYADTGFRDTQCGCKGLQLGVARALGMFGFIDGFAYDAELFYLASQLELTTQPVPVTWDDVSGTTVRASGARALLRDLRGISRASYVIPAVQLASGASAEAVKAAAVAVRQRGLVIARRAHDDVVLFPRDGGMNAIGVAQTVGGTITTVRPSDLVGATFDAV
jgi:glycosyltransferase involved in cell wall biosynthesis